MIEDTKSYTHTEMGSIKIRDIPQHPKGNFSQNTYF